MKNQLFLFENEAQQLVQMLDCASRHGMQDEVLEFCDSNAPDCEPLQTLADEIRASRKEWEDGFWENRQPATQFISKISGNA